MNKSVRKTFITGLIACGVIGGGVAVYQIAYGTPTVEIKPYDKIRDEKFIRNFFAENMYWLVDERATEYSLDYMLQNMVSSKDPAKARPITFMVLYEDKTPVGFVIYYRIDEQLGKLWFLGVDRPARGKGYASVLIRHVLEKLCGMGCKSVELVTRVHNNSALATYHKNGFYETATDGRLVTLRYDCR